MMRFQKLVGVIRRQKCLRTQLLSTKVSDPSSVTGKPPSVVMLGLPSDLNSSFLRGSAKAPPLIREALRSPSANSWSETPSIDISNADNFRDVGDLELSDSNSREDTYEQISAEISSRLGQGDRVLSIGGDHSVTYPIIAGGYAKHYRENNPLTIIQFDAHPDLYENFEDNPFSHASPFARILESTSVSRLIQVGVRTMNDHQREQASKYGVEVVTMEELDQRAPEAIKAAIKTIRGPTYISLDLDALDPAYAPGVSHHEPGGLTTRQIIHLIHCIQAPVVGADIVEYNPDKDINGVTAMVAAKFVKEIAAKMLTN